LIQELFHIGPLSISPFGVMLVLAFLAAFAQLRAGMRRLAVGGEDDASAILFAAGVGGIAGAKIYYALLYRDWHLLFDRAGLVWYGGLVAGAACVLLVFWRRRLPPWRTLDAATPALALGYGVGRIGCFLVGDDYGLPTSLPWGVEFPVGLPPSTAGYLRSEFGVDIAAEIGADQLLAVHPTQLYETLAAAAIWLFGRRLLRRSRQPGDVALPVLALLAAERFLVEFLRAKDDRLLGIFTVAQAISVVVLVALLWLWAARRRGGAVPLTEAAHKGRA
jgi:phosphatidylglycerol:prolipoprotein diacylglycerol transferase